MLCWGQGQGDEVNLCRCPPQGSCPVSRPPAIPGGAGPGGAGDSYMHLVTLSIWPALASLGSAFGSISKLE